MKGFDIGDLVIVNEFDRPCARLIAEVMDMGLDYLVVEYIDKSLEHHGKMRVYDISNPTKIEDFGMRLCAYVSDYGFAVCRSVYKPKAVYKNGRERLWQPELKDQVNLREEITVFGRRYCVEYFYKYFSNFIPGFHPDAIENYVLPFINNMVDVSDLTDARQRAEMIKKWSFYDLHGTET